MTGRRPSLADVHGRHGGTYLRDRVWSAHPLSRYRPIRWAARVLGSGDTSSTPLQAEAFGRWAEVGDPLADALVAKMKTDGGAQLRGQFEQALDCGIESVESAPAELVAFFDAVEPIPYWVDPSKLERGSRFYSSLGRDLLPIFLLGLSMSYLAQDANEVLLRSGNLNKKAARRAAETLTWTTEVTQPGALYPGHDGYRAAVRIRLTHAFMRSGIRNRDDWPDDRLPIHQGVYVATPILFSLITVLLAAMFGHLPTRRDRDAVIHLWRYIAYLVGVDPNLIATSEDDMWRLITAQFDHQVHLDEVTLRDGQALGGALIRAYGDLIGADKDTADGRARIQELTTVTNTVANALLGRHAAATLAYQPASVRAAVPHLTHAAANAARRFGAYAVPGGRRRYEDRQREISRNMIIDLDHRVDADLSYQRTG